MFKKVGILIVLISLTVLGANDLKIKIQNGKKTDIEVLIMKKDSNEENASNEENNEIQKYHIKNGDTLSKLSKKLDVSINDLIQLNDIENKDLIIAGTYLKYKEEGDE